MIQSTLGFHPVGGGARGGATAARGSGGARTGNDGGRESSSGSDDESQVGGGGGGDGGAEAGQIPKWAKRAGLSAAHVFGAVSKLMQTFEPKKGRGQKPFDRGGAEGKGVFPFGSMMVEPPDPIISHFGPLMKDTVKTFVPWEPFCVRKVFLWCPTMALPFTFYLDLVPCPSCKTTLHVKRKGWAPCVKVIDLEGVFWMTSLR